MAADIVFGLLNPIPFGFFVGALIFDVMYANSAEVNWFKAAAWLISIGLFVALIPRLINLVQTWAPRRGPGASQRAAFFIYLVGVVAAIVNAFVHSRDAYGVMPEGLWLSVITVVLLAVAHVLDTAKQSTVYRELRA